MTTQEPTMPSVSSLLPGLSGDNNAANTEVETLRSRSLLGRVVDDLNLVHDPDFNPDPTTSLSHVAQNTLARWVPLIPPASSPNLTANQNRTLTIDGLLKVITVSNVPDSMVFEVVVESADPAKAARIANTLSQFYIDRQISIKTTKNTQITQWLDTRVRQLQQQLEEKETGLAEFSADMELISPETHAALSADFKALRAKIVHLEDRASSPHLANRLAGLRKLEQNLRPQLIQQTTDLGQLQQLQREVFAAQQIYTQFLSQLEETTAQIDLAQPDSTILSLAETPVIPVRPRPMLVLLMTSVLGLFLAGGRLVYQETGRQTFRSEQELEDEIGQTVLGQLPLFPVKLRGGLFSRLESQNGGTAYETLRQLRSSVFGGLKAGPQVMMITSSLPNEGRSMLTLALAQSVAKIGQRVLVIDGDLRQKGLTEIVHIPVGFENGVLDVIAQRCILSDAIWRCQALKIDVLGGAGCTENPADLFSDTAFGDLLSTARDSYDVILIDTPPILAVPDARVVGAYVDTILYAVQWNQTKADAVREGLRSLRQSRLHIRGLVLTQIDRKALRHYGLEPQQDLLNYKAS